MCGRYLIKIDDRMPVILPKSLIDVWLKQSPEVVSQALTDLQFSPESASEKNANQLELFKV